MSAINIQSLHISWKRRFHCTISWYGVEGRLLRAPAGCGIACGQRGGDERGGASLSPAARFGFRLVRLLRIRPHPGGEVWGAVCVPPASVRAARGARGELASRRMTPATGYDALLAAHAADERLAATHVAVGDVALGPFDVRGNGHDTSAGAPVAGGASLGVGEAVDLFPRASGRLRGDGGEEGAMDADVIASGGAQLWCATRACTAALDALYKDARREGLAIFAAVLDGEAAEAAALCAVGGEGIYVRALVCVPRALWRTDSWRPSASSAWLAALRPCCGADSYAGVDGGADEDDSQPANAAAAAAPPALAAAVHCPPGDASAAPSSKVLQRLFSALPTHYSEVLKAAQTSESTRFVPLAGAVNAGLLGLWDVPPEALERVMALCSPAALRALGATCRHARTACAGVVPGLKCSLFPHQQAAVAWMLSREADRPPMPHHPAIRAHTTAGSELTYFIDPRARKGLALRTTRPPPVRDCRGGLFCDEPGLGKTVTALALILKTLGRVASPPKGIEPVWHPAPPHRASHARRAGYYEVDEDSVGDNTASVLSGRSSAAETPGDGAQPTGRRRTRSSGRSEVSYARDGVHLGGDAVYKMYGSVPSSLTDRPAKRARTSRVSPGKPRKPKKEHLPDRSTSDDDSRGPTNLVAGTTPEAEASPRSELDEQTWVQCEDCQKWRRLSPEAANGLNDGDAWFCALDASLVGGCSAPQEAWGEGAFHVSEGFLPPPGSAVAHARALGLLPDAADAQAAADAAAAEGDGMMPISDGTGLGAPGFTDPDAGVLAAEQEIALPDVSEAEALRLINAANHRFFSEVLSRSPEMYLNVVKDNFGSNRPARQAAIQQALVGDGLRVSGFNSSDLVGYRDVFRALGLETRVPAGEQLKGKSRQAQETMRRSALNVWYMPSWMVAGAQLDLKALRIACMNTDRVPRAVPQKRVFLSGATLVVLPGNLIQHWKRQMRRHVRGNDAQSSELGKGSSARAPLAVYVLETERDMLPAHELAWNYDVVLTTFQKLSVEWSRPDRLTRPMLCVHWLRVVLDEGHALGASLGVTNRLQMACALRAERRWIMTGTPTPATTGSGAAHMHPLLAFLREGAYGAEQRVFRDLVQRPLEGGGVDGEARLRECLKRVMIRASKEDLPTLAPCRLRVEVLDFEQSHARSYNALVDVIQRNLLLADWLDKEHQESLLHASQAKQQRLAMNNVRLASCVAGGLPVRPNEPHLREASRMLLAVRPQRNAARVPLAETALRHGGQCDCCARFCNVPVAIPRCACLLCVSCAASRAGSCARCGEPYAMEAAQYSGERHRVPFELIELNPAYEQEGHWRPDWVRTRSTKATRLVKHLRRLSPSDKSIVFSQFLEHLSLLEDTLSREGIGFAGLFAATGHHLTRELRDRELMRFEEDDTCRVLLIDGTSAVGLDLSFCSTVFIMEPVWDASLELQIISRAHRMGQRGVVDVRIMAMRGTVEEDILRMRGQHPGGDEERAADTVPEIDVDGGAIPLADNANEDKTAEDAVSPAQSQSMVATREEAELRTRRAVLMRLHAVREPDAFVDGEADLWSADASEGIEGGNATVATATADDELHVVEERAPAGDGAFGSDGGDIGGGDNNDNDGGAGEDAGSSGAGDGTERRRVRFADEGNGGAADVAPSAPAGEGAHGAPVAPVLPATADELYARLLGIAAMCQYADVPNLTAAVGTDELLRAMLRGGPAFAAAVREVYLRGTMAFVAPPHDDGKPFRYPEPQESNPWLCTEEALPDWMMAKLCTATSRLVRQGRV